SGERTRPDLAQKAAAFVRQIDKLPLPVKDSPGFLVNRVLGPYMHNAFRLLDEGMKPETLDAAMEAFGMPMGPAELADTVGLDICLHAGKALSKTSDVPQILASKVALGHLGKKTGQGIYRFEKLPEGKQPALRVLPMPADANQNGDIFGGWIMAQVDIAGGTIAGKIARGRVATVAVKEFVFKQPVQIGDLLSFYVEVEKIGSTSITVTVEVYGEGRPEHH